jgi:hypothetical protein
MPNRWFQPVADCLRIVQTETVAMTSARMGVFLAIAGLMAITGCGGSGSGSPSAAELDKAFATAAKATTDSGPASNQKRAAAAAAAIRARDYPKAMEELETLRVQKGLTPDQYMILNKVSGELMQKLVAQADKGNVQAKAALDRLKQQRDQR